MTQGIQGAIVRSLGLRMGYVQVRTRRRSMYKVVWRDSEAVIIRLRGGSQEVQKGM
jgi:hypothetical protein